jgi:hypothetical protein
VLQTSIVSHVFTNKELGAQRLSDLTALVDPASRPILRHITHTKASRCCWRSARLLLVGALVADLVDRFANREWVLDVGG